MGNKYLDKLRGQRVLIIGGTKGIGYGIAEAAIEHGGVVIVASRKQENVDSAVIQLKASYPERAKNISGETLDITAHDLENELERFFVAVTQKEEHKIDHLVETVGDGVPDIGLDNITVEKLEQESRLRIIGTTMLAKVARRYIHQKHTSSFSMTTGVLVDKPAPGKGILSAIGAYKEGLARGLAIDIAPIRVNVVSPGVIHTSMLDNMAGNDPENIEQMLKMMASQTLTERVGTVEDTAEIYLSLMKSSFATGSVVGVNGGSLLR